MVHALLTTHKTCIAYGLIVFIVMRVSKIHRWSRLRLMVLH